MKLLPWICGLSLAANLGLWAYHPYLKPAVLPSVPPPQTSAAPASPPSASPSTASSDHTPTAFSRATTALGQTLDGNDLSAMRAALEASGLTEDEAKSIIRARLRARQESARAAINQRKNPQEETWWYRDEAARRKFDDEKREDRKTLNDSLNAELAAVFGSPTEVAKPERIHDRAKFLPEAKQLAVTKIMDDYDAMLRDGSPRNYSGSALPSDEAKRRFIEAERRQDLIATLSPSELREYDLRHSQTAQNLQHNLDGMKPTRDEYEAIFDARQTIDLGFDFDRDSPPPDHWEKRQAAQAEQNQQLRQKLGEDRFIDYALSQDYQAKQIKTATERYQLAPGTSQALWKLRDKAGTEAKRVYDDKRLTASEKKAKLATLAKTSRTQMDKLLSGEARQELSKNRYVEWLDQLDANRINIYDPLGNGSSSFGLHE